MLVAKLWLFLVGRFVKKVKAKVPKELKISVIRKKKVLCNSKINKVWLVKKINYESKQEIKVQEM